MLPVIPLWAFSATPLLLGLGGFLIQVAVQGAWGIVPVHLNELSPKPLPAFVPQASANSCLSSVLFLLRIRFRAFR